jgi:chromosome segregation ATPase
MLARKVNPADLAALLGDPTVVEALRRHLGLPTEPVAAELRALSESQARLEDRMGRVEAALDRLTEAQARTDLRIEQLQARTDEQFARTDEQFARTDEKLAQLQTRTDEKFAQLLESQARADQRTVELQRRLDESSDRMMRAIEELTKSQSSLRAEVGALSSAYGFTLEDVARTVLPAWLQRHEKLAVESLEREFIQTSTGEEEVDLFATSKSGDETVSVVGEAKSRISARDVDHLQAKLERVRPVLSEARIVPLLFGFVVHPKARERGRALGIHVIASYDR